MQPTPSFRSSSPRCPAVAAPASPTSTLRGTASPARKRDGAGRVRGSLPGAASLRPEAHSSDSPPQEVPGCTCRAAALPQPRRNASAPGTGGLQASPRRAQVSVAAHSHAPRLYSYRPGQASSTSPRSYRTHNLPSILALPSWYSFAPWCPPSQLSLPLAASPPRALLEGLALNTHMGDLHLDLSACEVSSRPPT